MCVIALKGLADQRYQHKHFTREAGVQLLSTFVSAWINLIECPQRALCLSSTTTPSHDYHQNLTKHNCPKNTHLPLLGLCSKFMQLSITPPSETTIERLKRRTHSRRVVVHDHTHDSIQQKNDEKQLQGSQVERKELAPQCSCAVRMELTTTRGCEAHVGA